MNSQSQKSNFDIIYCTECGEALENFCFNKKSMNKKIISKQYHKCKKSKKFNGDVCSKLFISSKNVDDE